MTKRGGGRSENLGSHISRQIVLKEQVSKNGCQKWVIHGNFPCGQKKQEAGCCWLTDYQDEDEQKRNRMSKYLAPIHGHILDTRNDGIIAMKTRTAMPGASVH